MARFEKTHCSQCDLDLGPGDSGLSHCIDHRAPATLQELVQREEEALDVLLDAKPTASVVWARMTHMKYIEALEWAIVKTRRT